MQTGVTRMQFAASGGKRKRRKPGKRMNNEPLIKSFEHRAEVLRLQASEFSACESLIQSYAGSHSINWLLGKRAKHLQS